MNAKKISKITTRMMIAVMLAVFTICSFVICTDRVFAAEYASKTEIMTNANKSCVAKTTKMKKAAKKTYKTRKKTTKKYDPKTVVRTDTKKIVKEKTVKAITSTSYRKASKKKRVKTVKTTIIKTITTTKVNADTDGTTVKSLKEAVTPSLMEAFDKLGFEIKINRAASYAGVFSATKRHIEMKSLNANTFLHEMGHFLACLKNRADKTAEFKKIYQEEKNSYRGTNAGYVLSGNSEYFAASYKEYVRDTEMLKNSRPETYTYIDRLVKSISDTDIVRTENQYNWAW